MNNENNNVVQPVQQPEIQPSAPKKKSPIGIIILVVVLMIGCLVGGYFLNESGFFNKDKENTEEKDKKDKKDDKEPVVTVYDVTDEKVSKLISNLSRGLSCGTVEEFVSSSKLEASSITNVRAYIIASNDYYREKKDTITLDEFTKTVKKYLGEDYNFDPNTLNLDDQYCPFYLYNSETKEFTKRQDIACGGECGPSTTYKIVKAVDTDGILKLDVKMVFGPKEGDKYYSDIERTNVIGTFGEDVEGMYEKGSNYQFTFKLVDDYYAFVSSEPVK